MTTELGSTKPETQAKAPAAAKKPAGTWIVLEENDNIPPTGLFVGDNGRGYLLRPGEEICVPPGVLEILSNAVTSVPTVDPQSLQVIGYRNKMLYPFRIVNRQ